MGEYDPTEPSLGQAWANMLRGFQNPQQWQEVGQGIQNTAQVIPNVVESLGRGGVAQAVGTMGDLRDLRNTVQSYLPKSVQNFSNAAEFMTNPYAKALVQTAPTTEQTLETVPRMTPTYEGAGQHEQLGEYIAPSLGYFGGKILNAGKGLPVGLSIEDVTPPPAKVAEALRQPEKNALGFYSPLEEAVLGLKNEKGTGQQYLAQLLKTQGVKQEEVATRGLDTFLNENPKVSKEQLINYLRENPVNLKETVLQSDTARNLDSMNLEDYRLGEGQPIDDPDYISNRAQDIFHEDYANNPEIKQETLEDLVRQNPEKYADWETNDSIHERLMRDVDNELQSIAYDRANEEYWDNPYSEYTDEFGYKVVGNDDVGYHITGPDGHVLPAARHGVYDINMAESAIREDALERGLLHFDEDEYGTKYHDYTLPNGENYKEVLIQYEPKRSPPNYEIRELPEEDKTFGKYYGVYEGDKLINSWHGKTNAEDWVAGQKANYKDYGNYESGHFDEPNILTHLRTTDRTIDGKKTLFVEEIQSDWHQQGRKKGYATEATKERKAEIEYQLGKLSNDKALLRDYRDAAGVQGNLIQKLDYDQQLARLERQQVELRAELAGTSGVPDAPFKKNWQELAMKRAMQMAAEGGYDRVAFTTGKQQAERYNLSKQVDEIRYKKVGENEYSVAAVKDGREVIVKENQTPDQLSDLIGKEVTKKIVDGEGSKVSSGNADYHALSGIQLDVGGEGMKGFYDKILPDFINKYGKKHGLKVGKTKVDVKGGKPTDYADFDAYMTAKEGKGEEVHYFDLTPEAKESFLKKGQPMFAAAPLAVPATRKDILEQLFEQNQENK